jgi:20S proteasome subunit beta 7
MWDDGNSLGPKEIHSYLTRVMYNRRNKFDPLWNSLVLGGVKKGPKGEEKYLGMVSSSFQNINISILTYVNSKHLMPHFLQYTSTSHAILPG